MEVARAFPASPTSPRDARHFVVGMLASWGKAGVTDAAALLVTELVTNAVLHARSDVEITVQDHVGGVRIGVVDRSPVIPAPRRHSLDAATGRGLQLVADLSRAWGIDPLSGGKTIWFELVDGLPEPEPDVDSWLSDEESRAWR